MSRSIMSRRRFLETAALGAAAGALVQRRGVPQALAAGVLAAPRGHAGREPERVRLGVASYSFRKFSREQAVQMTKALRISYINLKSFHLPYDASPATIATARQEIDEAGLKIVGGGTITFEADTDDGVRKYFEYAKAATMPLIVGTCKPRVLSRVEKFAKLYDIEVAIHNHGPEDENFPSPYDVMAAVKGMDRRMGLCMDIGHTARTGTDIVQAAADAGPRLLDIHAKDLRDVTDKASQCIVGEGVLPIAALFRQLEAMRYPGYVNLEYEIDAENPLPGMQQSVAYMRGALAGIGSAVAGGR